MTFSYEGARYYGWEHQPGRDTIQGKIENVLMHMLLGHEGKEKSGEIPEDFPVPEVIGCGRTDAGVSALAYVASVRLDTDRTPDEIMDYMNRYLPDDIAVTDVTVASDRFHARYNAVGKTYKYTLYCGDSKPVFDRRTTTILHFRPDVEAMRTAAALLVGEHDFKSFCGNTKMKKSTVRLVDSIDINCSNNYIYMTFHGTGFLQHMVRILVGTLLEVGAHRMKPEDMPAILDAKDRKAAGPTAPPEGLMMVRVEY